MNTSKLNPIERSWLSRIAGKTIYITSHDTDQALDRMLMRGFIKRKDLPLKNGTPRARVTLTPAGRVAVTP